MKTDEEKREYQKEYYRKNKDRIKERNAHRYEQNKERILAHNRKYNHEHKEQLSEYQKKWLEEHRGQERERLARQYQKDKKKRLEIQQERIKNDPVYKLSRNIRRLILLKFQEGGYTKKSKTADILGCSFEELKSHLEQTWFDNYGTPYNGELVHIDHIIPLATAKTEEDVIRLNHYTNLQYLTPEDNLKKGDKLDYSR